MICPHCHSETSDMRPVCEVCGKSVFAAGPQGEAPAVPQGAGPHQPVAPQGPPRAAPPPGGAPHTPPQPPYPAPTGQGQYRPPPPASDAFGYGPPPQGEGFYPPPIPGAPPSEWSTPGRARPTEGRSKNPLYLSPWPYVVGIVVVVGVVVGLVLFRGKATAYPELLVNNRPTMLDFYTNT